MNFEIKNINYHFALCIKSDIKFCTGTGNEK